MVQIKKRLEDGLDRQRQKNMRKQRNSGISKDPVLVCQKVEPFGQRVLRFKADSYERKVNGTDYRLVSTV